MSEQKNTTIEQADKMEDASEYRATQSTSRTPSREKVMCSPTPSEISDIANELVSDIMGQAADNVDELLDSITRWRAEEERAKSESEFTAACCTQQKVERNLTRFFEVRRVFAEHRGETPEVTEEDLVPEVDSTQEQEADRTDKKPVSKNASMMYKKMKSKWKACFRWMPRKKNQSPGKEDLDETESDDFDSKSDVTPEKFIEDAVIDAPSQEDDKDTCKTSLAVTQETSPAVSTCSYDMSADPLVPTISSLSGSTQPVERREPSLVHPGAEKNVDETHSSDVPSICSSHEQMFPITSAGSSEKLAMDSLEEQCREEKGRHEVRSVVKEGDLVMKMDSTLVLSGQDGPASSNLKSIATCPEKISPPVSISSSELTGLQNIFYTIVKEFFDGLSFRQRTEISRGIYYMDVKGKLLDICVEVLTVILQAITDTLTEAIGQNPTIFKHCRMETFKQTLGSALGMTFCDVVSAETFIKIPPKFKETVDQKITDQVSSVMSVAIPASEDGVDENTWCEFSTCGACKMLLSNVKAVLCGLKFSKQTSQTVSNDSDAPTIKVHKKKSRWWRCFRKQRNKIQPVSHKQTSETPASDNITNEIKAPVQDPAAETKRPSLLKRNRRFCCCLCCFSPGDIEQ